MRVCSAASWFRSMSSLPKLCEISETETIPHNLVHNLDQPEERSKESGGRECRRRNESNPRHIDDIVDRL